VLAITSSKKLDQTAALLSSYPRKRKPLTAAHEAIYVQEYRSNRMGKRGLSRVVSSLESWMHRAIASSCVSGSILELGAGTLNHIPCEPSVSSYEIVEPFHALWEDSPYRSRISAFYDDVLDIPQQRRYDRILSVAVLEHLTDLPRIVARSGMLLAPGGCFSSRHSD